jgi:hypothetical protein
MKITDNMCRLAVEAWQQPDRIQGFSTPHGRGQWGPPHTVRDVHLPHDKQELWRGDTWDEMSERCQLERMRLALKAALTADGSKLVYDKVRRTIVRDGEPLGIGIDDTSLA